jgi:hypothetical protein
MAMDLLSNETGIAVRFAGAGRVVSPGGAASYRLPAAPLLRSGPTGAAGAASAMCVCGVYVGIVAGRGPAVRRGCLVAAHPAGRSAGRGVSRT